MSKYANELMNITFLTQVRELARNGKINPRSYNTCIANGIETIRDLDLNFDPESGFLHFRNCGHKTNNELVGILKEVHAKDIDENAQAYMRTLPEIVRESFKKTIEDVFPTDGTSSEAKLFYTFFTPETFVFKVYTKKDNLLLQEEFEKAGALLQEETGTIELYRLRKKMISVLGYVCDRLAGNFDNGVRRERTQIKRIRQMMEHTLHTNFIGAYYEALLSADKMDLAGKEFERLVSTSQRIVQNFVRKKELTLANSWKYLNISADEFYRIWPTSRKGAQGYLEILSHFRDYLEHLSTSSAESDKRVQLQHVFDFLTDEEAENVIKFRKQRGHLPMFYITDRYFATTNNRQHQIFARCFGLGGRSPRRKTEVAEELGMTRERVRQIVTETDFSRLSLAHPDHWREYPYPTMHFISTRTKQWSHDMATEGVTPEFISFAGIMVAMHGFAYKRLAGIEKFIVLPRHIERYTSYMKRMLDLRDKTHVENIIVRFPDFLDQADYEDKVIRETVKRELTSYLDIEVISENMFFPHNTVDIAAEVESILRKEGNPLHIDEILERMHASFPKLKLTRERLKFQMRNSNEIVAKGKTSLYCLRSWTHVFIGSIRDLVKQILANSNVPLSINEIMEVVSNNFETTRYNVYNSLFISSDFTLFEGRKFGLSAKKYPREFKPYTRSSNQKSFAERFADYKQFVETFGHHPYNSGIMEEEVLKRWQCNIIKRFLRISEEERKEFDEFMHYTQNLPFTYSEYRFKLNTEKYLKYVRKTGMAPTPKSEPELTKWYRKTSASYRQLNERKKGYFDEFLAELAEISSDIPGL